MKTKIFLTAMACVSLASAQVSVTTVLDRGLAEPYNVAVDGNNNFYISDSVHNELLRVDGASGTVSVLAGIAEDGDFLGNDGFPWEAHFFSPQGLTLGSVGGADGLIVADTGNHSVRFVRFSDGFVQTLAGVAGEMGNADGAAGVSRLNNPLGVASDGAGHVYIADSGNNVVRVLDLGTGNLTTLAVTGASFDRPPAVTVGASGQLWVASGHRVALLTLDSPGSASWVTWLGTGTVGTKDSLAGSAAQFNAPRGLFWWADEGQLLISDTGNHTIRRAIANPTYGLNNFSVATLAGVPGLNGYTNGPALSTLFDTPVGLSLDTEAQGFLVADLKNNAIRRIQNGPVRPPVSTPQIGWVDFIWNDSLGTWVTLLRTDDQPRVFNNLVDFAILRERGTECHYTTANTVWPPGFTDASENPSKTVGATPPDYLNSVPKYMYDVNPPAIQVERSATLGGVVIKAIGFAVGRQNSAVAKANYAFKAGTPVIVGNNLASFRVYTVTTNPVAAIHYTTDGSDPDVNDPAVPQGGQLQIELPEGQTQVVFKARAFADTFLPSDVMDKTFSATNFVPTRMTLGFPSGEASSRFIASPGQTYYTPVTLQLAEGSTMFSLQFNLMITNVWPAPPLPPGARLDFASMLYEEVPLEKGEKAPPYQGKWYRTIPPAMWSAIPGNRYIYRESDPSIPLIDLTFYDASIGLIGVGWIEKWLFKDLYDTTEQDLITYSIARDTLFVKTGNRVVLGAAAFQVPVNATATDQYRLSLGRPSATMDGVGAPGSQVFIATPTQGYLTNGGFLAQRLVSMGQEKYVVGDAAPFRWLNAGEFGDATLLNDDVLQVFGSAIYNMSPTNPATGFPSDPPFYSDFRDALDAGPILGVPDEVGGYYVPGAPTSWLALFDGDDTTINQVAFGDGVLDVTDVYITFRRSLDPSLQWWRRFYANGMRVAEPVPNTASAPQSPPVAASPKPEMGGQPAASELNVGVEFSAGDALATAGQTVQIPIRARVWGDYPLRVLMLNLRVQPLEGAPALTDAVVFTPVAALGAPTITAPTRPDGYGAAWLNSHGAGLSGDALLGTLTVKIPSGVASTAAYAVHFEHASGSPNGLAPFPPQWRPGLITLADRSGSSVGDGIADAWRLRYFGAVNAVLAGADADADGDGHNNRAEWRTGTNPNDCGSVLRVRSRRAAEGASGCVVRWPSVVGKRYVIESASSLYGATWEPASTVTGTGAEMELTDSNVSGTPRFYRVRVTE